MAKQLFLFLLVLFVIILAGCSQSTFSFSPTATNTASATLTVTPTLTHTPIPTSTFTPTPTITPLPYPLATCDGNQNFVTKWQTELGDMKFEALLCPDNTLIAIFHNQEFEEYITINQGTSNKAEYEWSVSIDSDSNTSTGTPETSYDGIVGADYSLSISHFVYGKAKRVLFNEAFQKNVWDCTSGTSCRTMSNDVEYYGDPINKFIVIRGKVSDINTNSKVLFSRYKFRLSDRLTYKTDWVASIPVP